MKIYLGADHAGFELKENLKKKLQGEKYIIRDMGALKYKKLDDYPDYAKKVALKLAPRLRSGSSKKTQAIGILICGSGVGICMAANRYKHIRAANCPTIYAAYRTRMHNDANVLCLSGRNLSQKKAWLIFKKFVNTPFKGGRHARRVKKMSKMG